MPVYIVSVKGVIIFAIFWTAYWNFWKEEKSTSHLIEMNTVQNRTEPYGTRSGKTMQIQPDPDPQHCKKGFKCSNRMKILRVKEVVNETSIRKQCRGSGMFIPHPGSRGTVRDPGSATLEKKTKLLNDVYNQRSSKSGFSICNQYKTKKKYFQAFYVRR